MHHSVKKHDARCIIVNSSRIRKQEQHVTLQHPPERVSLIQTRSLVDCRTVTVERSPGLAPCLHRDAQDKVTYPYTYTNNGINENERYIVIYIIFKHIYSMTVCVVNDNDEEVVQGIRQIKQLIST